MDEIRRTANRRAAFITHLIFTLLAFPGVRMFFPENVPAQAYTLTALIFLIILHVFWLLYGEIRDRMIKRLLTQQESEKQKNEVIAASEESASNWQVGDDGELWEVSEQQQKRLTQE